MKDLKPVKGSFYIRRLIEEGEHEHQDFKFAIGDARKIARSISAFANNDGGRLLVGVKDNGAVAGVRNEEDIFVVEQAAAMYCRPAQEVAVTAFKVDGGAVVFRVEIARSARRPVEVKEAADQWKAYYRVADENISVPPFVARAWRAAASGGAGIVTLSEREQRLIGALDGHPGMTPAEIARHAMLTARGAESLIARLHAMKLVDFRYSPGGFVVVSTNDTTPQ